MTNWLYTATDYNIFRPFIKELRNKTKISIQNLMLKLIFQNVNSGQSKYTAIFLCHIFLVDALDLSVRYRVELINHG